MEQTHKSPGSRTELQMARSMCWHCQSEMTGEYFCDRCVKVQPLSKELDYFTCLGLPRRLKIDAAGAERSRAKIDEAFSNVGALLGDGRRYLIGDRFTVADLTFAALAAPVLLPPQYGAPLPTLDMFPAPAKAQLETWRRSPPGQFALRIYAEHR